MNRRKSGVIKQRFIFDTLLHQVHYYMPMIKTNLMKKFLLFFITTVGFVFTSFAQNSQPKAVIADKIVGQVGDKIILYSDIYNSVLDAQRQGVTLPPNPECVLIEAQLIQKALVLQAEKDSLPVSEDDIEAQLDNKIRFYIQQGLIPAPETRGPGAHYGPEHVGRLRLIKRLQQEHLPLSEIRRRIEKLSPEDVKRILETRPDHAPNSASEYVRRVLSEGVGSVKAAEPVGPSYHTSRPNKPPAPMRSQWERFTLAPDVELHVRRPGSREDQRKIDRLLEAAREIFKEDLP